MTTGRPPAPAGCPDTGTGRTGVRRCRRRDAAEQARPGGPASRPARRSRNDPRTCRRAGWVPAVAPRPGRPRSPDPTPVAADGPDRRRLGSAGPGTGAAIRSSARRPRTARRDRATGRRSRDSSAGPVVPPRTWAAGRVTLRDDRAGQPGLGHAEPADRRPLAHGRAPMVGSRPLAHGECHLVGNGRWAPARNRPNSLVPAPNGCARRVAAWARSTPLWHSRRTQTLSS